MNGNDHANRKLIATTVSGISWMSGQSLWLRWVKEVGSEYFWAGQLLAIDDFTFTAVPTLQMLLIPDGTLRLSWSTNFAGFRLQSEIDFSNGNWTDISQPPARMGERFELILEPNDKQRFFRLVQ